MLYYIFHSTFRSTYHTVLRNQIAENSDWLKGQSETFWAELRVRVFRHGLWACHVCVCLRACVCMRKAAYSFAFEYLYPNVCLSYSLTLCVGVSLYFRLYVCVCVCWVYLSKSKVLACKIYRVRCQAKTSFAAPLTFVFVTSFVSISQLNPENCNLWTPLTPLAPSLLSLSTVLQLLLSQG